MTHASEYVRESPGAKKYDRIGFIFMTVVLIVCHAVIFFNRAFSLCKQASILTST